VIFEQKNEGIRRPPFRPAVKFPHLQLGTRAH
jgi:hypothetical protein